MDETEAERARAVAPAAAVTTPATIRPSPPLAALHRYEPLHLDSHRALAQGQPAITSRINSDPALSVMLLINPVLAFKEFGVDVTPEVSRHIMHTLQFLPAARKQHDALEQSLTQALGEAPRPNDAAWLAHTLFEKLKVQPYDTTGLKPAYAEVLDQATLHKLQSLRPARKPRYPQTRLIKKTSRLGLAPTAPAVRLFDLTAALPAMRPAAQAPQKLSLTELYFYKDSNPVARQLLEYGMVLQLGFSFNTPAAFRQVRDGSKPNAFRAWIKAVRFDGPPK